MARGKTEKGPAAACAFAAGGAFPIGGLSTARCNDRPAASASTQGYPTQTEQAPLAGGERSSPFTSGATARQHRMMRAARSTRDSNRRQSRWTHCAAVSADTPEPPVDEIIVSVPVSGEMNPPHRSPSFSNSRSSVDVQKINDFIITHAPSGW